MEKKDEKVNEYRLIEYL